MDNDRARDSAATPLEFDRRAQREHSLEQLAFALPVPIARIDLAQRHIFANQAYAEQFGRDVQQILGRELAEVLGEDNYAEARPHLTAALGGERARSEALITGPGAGPRYLELAYVPERGLDGRVAGCFISLTDVTAHKRTEEALRESEQRFREMSDGLPLIVWVHDAAGAQEFVNGTFCEFFGVRREDMRGGRWQLLMHPEDAEAYLHEFTSCVRDRRTFHAETRVKRSDGEWRWIESWGRPRFTPSGEFRGFVGTSADITARKQGEDALRESERALRASEERFRHLADAMPQLVWIATDDGTVRYYNSRAAQFSGLAPTPAGDWRWQPVVHPDELETTSRLWRTAVESGSTTYECEHRLRMADGGYRWHLSRAHRVREHDGKARWFGTATDVHELKEAQEALRETDRRKDEFLAMLGHELRNPLAAIRTATDFLKHAEAREPQLQRAYEVLERQSMQMARLLEDLLDVTRIARGKVQLNRQPLDFRQVIDAVLHDHLHDTERRGLALEKGQPAAPVWVSGDSVRLTQILENLVGNAIKFTKAPGVLSVELQTQGAQAVLSVTDTGVGIRAELLSQIFEPFQQEAQDIARASGGLGLGLALAKGLVEMHGGTIEAHSAGLGTGARFVVRLPLGAPPPEARSPGGQRAVGGHRVLILEDNEDAALMLHNLLELRGHAASVVHDGGAALEHLRRHGTDIVICDIGLPDMDGFEFARRVRADPALSPIMLVALTGYGQPEDRKRTQEAGFDAHLVKPIDLHALESVFERRAS